MPAPVRRGRTARVNLIATTALVSVAVALGTGLGPTSAATAQAAAARSATFTITSLDDTATDTSIGTPVGASGNYQGTLRQAINFANQNLGAPGNGAAIVTTINTSAGLTGTITLAGNLPLVATNVTLDGGGLTVSGGNQFRGLIVSGIAADGQNAAATTAAISNLNFQNVTAQGGNGADGGGGGLGAGGAVFVGPAANVSLTNVGVTGARAIGGAQQARQNGGEPDSGGGGGLTGNAGTVSGRQLSGSGGGGILFNGGNTTSGFLQGNSGGGGGGIRAFSGRPESKGDSHGRADLIHGAGWMEAGMDGQAVVDGSSVASAGRG